MIPQLRPKVDLLVVLLHSGFVRDPVTGEQAARIQVPGENVAEEFVQQVPGVDVIIYGHVHSELPEKVMNGVLLTEAKFWGQSLARVDVTMTKGPHGHWQVASKHFPYDPGDGGCSGRSGYPQAGAALPRGARPVSGHADRHVRQALTGGHADYEDNALLDVIQHAEMKAGADLGGAYGEARRWVRTTPAGEVARVEANLFPGHSLEALEAGIARYQKVGCWEGGVEIPRDLYDQAFERVSNGGRYRETSALRGSLHRLVL